MDTNSPDDPANPANIPPQDNTPLNPLPSQEEHPQNVNNQTVPPGTQHTVPPVSSVPSPVTDPVITAPAENTAPPVPPVTSEPVLSTPQTNSGKRPSMRILSLVVLFIGVLTGVILFATGIFRNDRLRLGEYGTNNQTQGVVPQKEKIIVGTDATYPPMEYTDTNENLIGYDVDLARKIAEELGADVEFRNIPFDKVFTALENGEVNIVMSSVTITDERKLKYNFSEPYINAGQVIVTARDNPETQMTPEKLSGKRVGVQKGTTSEEEALKYASRSLVSAFSDYPEAVAALNSKKIDVIIIDLTAAKGLVDENPNLRIASDPFTNEYYGVVLSKNDIQLKERIDEVINSLTKRGILDNIKQKWFQ